MNSVDNPSSLPIKVLVTGAHGFLGRHVMTAFELSSVHLLAPKRSELDLLDGPAVCRYFEIHRPTHVVHLAAACGGIASNVAAPAHFLHANTLMGLNLLEAARLTACEKFVLVSTTCAYPEDAAMPLDEDSIWQGLPTAATRAYGLAKRFLHEAVVQYEAQYGLRGVVLIPANLYGEGDHYDERSHVVAALIKRYVDATEANVECVTNWGTGEATREFLHVADAAEAIRLATFKLNHSRPVNIGTGIETSIKSLAEQIASLVGFNGKIGWDPSKPSGQPRRCLNTQRAKQFGFEARITLSEGLARTIDDYRSRHR
ncbi:MAG: NAD-dependent epimerase/dehydratase family protein [Bradymonadia bacterium]